MFRPNANHVSFVALVLTGLLPASLRADGPRRIYSLADLAGPPAAASLGKVPAPVGHPAADVPPAAALPAAHATSSPPSSARSRRPAEAQVSLGGFHAAATGDAPASSARAATVSYAALHASATTAAEIPLSVTSCHGGVPIVTIIEEIPTPAPDGRPLATRRFGAWLEPEQEGRTARQFFELGLFRDPPWYGWYGPYWFGYPWGAYRPWGFRGGYYGSWFPRYYGAYGGAYPFGYSPVWYTPRGYAPPAGGYGRATVW